MKNTDIAKKVASAIFTTLGEDDSEDHAVQLFVENTVLPDDVNDYTQDQLARYIHEFLESKIQ